MTTAANHHDFEGMLEEMYSLLTASPSKDDQAATVTLVPAAGGAGAGHRAALRSSAPVLKTTTTTMGQQATAVAPRMVGTRASPYDLEISPGCTSVSFFSHDTIVLAEVTGNKEIGAGDLGVSEPDLSRLIGGVSLDDDEYDPAMAHTTWVPKEMMFRTKPCSFFFHTGHCQKGDRCNFAHQLLPGMELPPPPPSVPPRQSPPPPPLQQQQQQLPLSPQQLPLSPQQLPLSPQQQPQPPLSPQPLPLPLQPPPQPAASLPIPVPLHPAAASPLMASPHAVVVPGGPGPVPAGFVSVQQLYRTKPCKFFFEKGTCLKGDRCNFSHDPAVLKRAKIEEQAAAAAAAASAAAVAAQPASPEEALQQTLQMSSPPMSPPQSPTQQPQTVAQPRPMQPQPLPQFQPMPPTFTSKLPPPSTSPSSSSSGTPRRQTPSSYEFPPLVAAGRPLVLS